MQRRYSLAHLILAVVVALSLIPLMVVVGAQAQIAFVSQRDGNPEIYLMDDEGRNQQRLTNNHHGDWTPSWSPNGKRIVFQSNRDWDNPQNTEIYVMDEDGKNEKKSLKIPMRTSILHGLPTVNVLFSSLVGRDTLKAKLESLMKST